MKKTTRQMLKRFLVVFLLINIFFLVLIQLHKKFEYNVTPSLPTGLYIKLNKEIERNDIVTFCPIYNKYMRYAEQHGYWKNLYKRCGSTPVYMKRVVGLPKDNVTVNFDGVFVNSIKVKYSEPVIKILSDKIFKSYSKTFLLQDDEYFLMGDNPLSYDSRYFGIINKKQVKAVVLPFLTGGIL